MGKSKVQGTSTDLVETVKNAILEKKGENILVLNLKKIPSAVCDYFVICDGNSNVHVEGIAQEIEKEVREQHQEKPWHKEGYSNAQWILMDYSDVVVHVFQKETRAYYELERLWADASTETVESEY